jgi:transcription elongation factor Elf1
MLQIVTKKRPKLSKRFKCPFCANDDTVECKMDFKAGIGSLSCRLCGAAYQMPINSLAEPIDVFSEWLDDCEAAQNQSARSGGGSNGNAKYDEGEEDDELPQSSGLGRKPSANSKNDRNARSIDLGDVDSDDDDDDE